MYETFTLQALSVKQPCKTKFTFACNFQAELYTIGKDAFIKEQEEINILSQLPFQGSSVFKGLSVF
jgi:hypothetical protein